MADAVVGTVNAWAGSTVIGNSYINCGGPGSPGWGAVCRLGNTKSVSPRPRGLPGPSGQWGCWPAAGGSKNSAVPQPPRPFQLLLPPGCVTVTLSPFRFSPCRRCQSPPTAAQPGLLAPSPCCSVSARSLGSALAWQQPTVQVYGMCEGNESSFYTTEGEVV